MLTLPSRLADRYRVGVPLGRGAIAEVVRAVDERSGAELALKVLYPALRENPVVVERFRREVELGRRIQDRHVLGLHEVIDSAGFLFLVMDYHPGGDLADRIARQRRLAVREIQALAAQLGGALAAAHRVGIVHRDVKPSNVLAGPGPGLDVRLCDFGLARSAEGAGLTTSAAVLGTPEYMAPEVIAEGHADPRSDLYSLGIVLFEAATGRLPFVADSPYQMMRLHLHDDPPRARDLVGDLPPALDAALTRALAKDPLDRYASAEEMAQSFAHATDGDGDGHGARSVWSTPAPPRSPPCPACGGWLVEVAGVCADCGHELLRLEYDKRGVSILINGPGATGDQLDARKHVALYRLLAELPESPEAPTVRQARAPRFPFYVARGLTPASAERLLPRLQAIGLEGRIEARRWLGPPEMRKKIGTLAGRLVGGTGAVGVMGQQVHDLIPRDLLPGFWRFAAFPLSLMALGAALWIGAARKAVRPLLLGPRSGAGSRALPPLAPPPAAELGTLGGWLRRLASRQDRRLLARIHERLLRLGHGPDAALVPAAAARAVQLAAALGQVDQAGQANEAAALDRASAQAELRRLERGRVLLRSELLRLSSHLEALASGGLCAGSQQAAGAAAAAGAASEALTLELTAHEELEDFLALASAPTTSAGRRAP